MGVVLQQQQDRCRSFCNVPAAGLRILMWFRVQGKDIYIYIYIYMVRVPEKWAWVVACSNTLRLVSQCAYLMYEGLNPGPPSTLYSTLKYL